MPSYPPYSHEDYARDGSKTARKGLRQRVRQALGTSSDPAPAIDSALLAAGHLADLISYASNGRFVLQIADRGQIVTQWQARRKLAEEIEVSKTVDAVRVQS